MKSTRLSSMMIPNKHILEYDFCFLREVLGIKVSGCEFINGEIEILIRSRFTSSDEPKL
jgi:hypothetical protein